MKFKFFFIYLLFLIPSYLSAKFDLQINSNCKYQIIDKDYDLQGDTLFVPRGCVLDFRGGSFSNGYICSDFASISAPLQQIFSVNVRLLGNWQNERLPVEWYGALGDDKTDCSVAINAAINNTTFRVVSLLAGHKYLITQSIKMRSSDFAFGCFDVAYSHESSPAAYIYSNSSEPILEFPKGESIQGLNLKGLVLHKRWKYRYQGDGIHIEQSALYRSIFEGIRIYYCNNGYYQEFGDGYKGFSLNKFTNCVFGGCKNGFQVTFPNQAQYSYWINLNSWDNCHFSYNLNCGLIINNVYSCEQNTFYNCGFEGMSKDENVWWKNDSDICGVFMKGCGYGLTTFYNCYFERNHPLNSPIKPNNLSNEKNPFCVADVILDGALVSFDKCTFNEGITPIILRIRNIGINIEKSIFRHEYLSNSIVLFKNIGREYTKKGNYFRLMIPAIESKYVNSITKDINCDTKELSKEIKYLTVR